MGPLETLQSLGIELPSPLYMLGAALFGLVGIAAYRHGKRVDRQRTRWLGVALMFYPYAIAQTWLLYLVGAVLCLGILTDRG